MSEATSHQDGPVVAHHFETWEQHEESCTMGMWLFLAQEVMFFGGMFVAYAVYRYMYPEAWYVGSSALDWKVGAFNTSFLLLSSFTMAMGVYYNQTGRINKLFGVMGMLWATLILGIIFVAVKLKFEWFPKYAEGAIPGDLWNPHHHYQSLADFDGPGGQGAVQLFYWLYFVMTGMHALHMLIGFGIIIWLMLLSLKGRFSEHSYLHILFFGLYWHFVDIVWIFLYPMFYLVNPV